MALGAKTSGQIHNKTGDDLLAMKAKYDQSKHLEYIGFDEIDAVLHQMQLMQDDIDELRRFVADSNELRSVVSPLPVANGGTGLTSSQPLISLEISITSGEMASLDGTRKTLVSAPGSGKIIIPVRAMILCQKLNGSVVNLTSVNLLMGYYHGDNRDISRLPVMEVLGLLYRSRDPGTYNMVPSKNVIYNSDILFGENKELALILSGAPGSSGATTSTLQLMYYIADIT